jgi:hypothetical protein
VRRSYFLFFGRPLTFLCDPAGGFRNGASLRWMLQELTFVDSVLLPLASGREIKLGFPIFGFLLLFLKKPHESVSTDARV